MMLHLAAVSRFVPPHAVQATPYAGVLRNAFREAIQVVARERSSACIAVAVHAERR
jgi:hypothetical protein